MAEYDVILEREVTEEGYITVEANSANEAMLKAEELPASEISWDRIHSDKHWPLSAETCEDDLKAIQRKLEALDGSDTRLLDDLRAGGHPIASEED